MIVFAERKLKGLMFGDKLINRAYKGEDLMWSKEETLMVWSSFISHNISLSNFYLAWNDSLPSGISLERIEYIEVVGYGKIPGEMIEVLYPIQINIKRGFPLSEALGATTSIPYRTTINVYYK